MRTAMLGSAVLLALSLPGPAAAIPIDFGTLHPGISRDMALTVHDRPNWAHLTWDMDWAAFGAADPRFTVEMAYRIKDAPAPFDGTWGPDWSYLHVNFDPGYSFDIRDWTTWDETVDGQYWYGGAVTLTFSGLDRNRTSFWAIPDYAGNAAVGYFDISYSVSPVPLPAAGWLLASAIGLAGLAMRKIKG